MKKAGFILIFAVLFSIINSLFCSAALGSLENFGMSYIGSGYAAPVDFFNNNFPIFYLNSENFVLTNDNQTVNLSINARFSRGYVYKLGWIWNPRLGDWIPFQFDNPGVSGSYWINGTVNPSSRILKTLSINAKNNLENGLNFIAVFSCKKYNNQWKCGCDSANDVSCNKWSLLAFNVSNANWTVEKPSLCVTDSDCNLLAGEKCISNTCTFVPQCNNDSQCGDGKRCLNRLCTECLDNSHCTSPKKCFNQKCLDCMVNSDCTIVGQKCFNNVCAECSNDSDCSIGQKCAGPTCVTPSSFCYQESANVTNQVGTDGNCGLNYSGSYGFPNTGAYFYINYTKPLNMLGAVWQVKHGVSAAYNATLPLDCFKAYSSKLLLRMYSFSSNEALRGNVTRSYGECYNGSTWKIITPVPQDGGDAPSVNPGDVRQNLYDGNWNTHAFYSLAGTWYLTTGSPYGRTVLARIFEEAIIWWN